jgi:hypothetical protein
MFNVSVEKQDYSTMQITPMSIKRDWMDQTSDNHAYRCFPVTQANVIGWNISCLEDINFVWNGINDQSGDNIQLLSSENIAYTGRGQSTISFNTGLVFKTDQNVSLLTINPVNYFFDDFETMSSLITTSFYDGPLPLAIKARSPNKNVLIKAGTPLGTIIPISLSDLNNTCIEINRYQDNDSQRKKAEMSYGFEAQKINQSGEWTDWYRNGVNEKGETLGNHEVKVLKLSVKNNIGDII